MKTDAVTEKESNAGGEMKERDRDEACIYITPRNGILWSSRVWQREIPQVFHFLGRISCI